MARFDPAVWVAKAREALMMPVLPIEEEFDPRYAAMIRAAQLVVLREGEDIFAPVDLGEPDGD